MLDHVFVSVSDLDRSIEFYERALAQLGIRHAVDYDGANGPEGHPDLKGFGRDGRMFFWLRHGSADARAVHVGFVAKSEAEVSARQIAIERDELRLMPDLEEKELALILEVKGLTPENARVSAEAMMRDPTRALATKVQEELGIQPASVTPLADGLVTGTATAVGAIIPLLPFLMVPAGPAIWLSLTVSMLAHFGVGAARSIFTGRSMWASGRDMFLVGFGVAAIGYVIGALVMKQ